MSSNRSVTYQDAFNLTVEGRPYPKLEHKGRKIEHGAILKVVSTNICGSDQHIFRGRFSVPVGTVLGHEITGEIVEVGRDVEMLSVGDLCSVPFNVACGRCRNCKGGHTDVCETVNDAAPVGAYGFDLGGWDGGQAEYVLVPYADWNLLKFQNKDRAMAKIRDLTLISDILPTGHHGCVSAGVGPGKTAYIAGAGPVGRCAAASARLLGASCIIVGDQNRERLEVLKAAGYEVADLSSSTPLPDQIEAILGVREVDCGVDAVGFEAHGHGENADEENGAAVMNALFDVVRARGKLGVPGIYEPNDPGASGPAADGRQTLDWGKAWLKSLQIMTGMAPVSNYNRDLSEAILWDRMPYLADTMNIEVITLDDAPKAYADFSDGSAKKFVIDPHGMLAV